MGRSCCCAACSNQLRAELAAAGKEQVFATLKDCLIDNRTAASYRLAATLDISEAAARVTVHRLRRRYRELLWREVARTLPGAEHDVAAEIKYLLTIVQDPSAPGLAR